MTIAYSIPPESNAVFAIYDMTGRKISSYILPGTSTLMTINNSLNDGVYIYNLVVDGTSMAQGRLVIINF